MSALSLPTPRRPRGHRLFRLARAWKRRGLHILPGTLRAATGLVLVFVGGGSAFLPLLALGTLLLLWGGWRMKSLDFGDWSLS